MHMYKFSYWAFINITIVIIFFCCSQQKINCSNCNTTKLDRVLILGNSITQHAPEPRLGWFGNWGMAASSQEKDFVHLLTENLKSRNREIQVKYVNISSFEKQPWPTDTTLLIAFKNFNPDIIIFRLGDNMATGSLNPDHLNKGMNALIQQVSMNAPAQILLTSRFWPDRDIDNKLKQCAIQNRWTYLDISKISADKGNMAINKFTNPGVSLHPSDLGMQQISKYLYEAILKM